MVDSNLNRWEEKEDSVSKMLRDQNEDLIKKYKDQCEVSKELEKQNENLFDKIRKHTVVISEIRNLLNDL
jgi:hypothetical protein